MLFPVGKDISLDIGLKYNWVKDGRYYNFEGGTSTYISTAQYFTFSVGLSFAYTE
jgi:hypothetical protein